MARSRRFGSLGSPAPLCFALLVVLTTAPILLAGPPFPIVVDVERQPLVSATRRLVDALDFVGSPLKADDQHRRLTAAMTEPDGDQSVRKIQAILDPYCLFAVTINPESRVSVVEGPAPKELVQQGWRTFLLKVINQAGITPELKAESPNAAPLFMQGHGDRQQPLKTEKLVPPGEISQRFLDIDIYKKQPLRRALSGLGVEYRVVMLYSRDAGKREADIGFNVGQGTQDLGFRSSVPILFNCLPAAKVVLRVKDYDGQPTSGSFVVRDKLERVYPNPARLGTGFLLPQPGLSGRRRDASASAGRLFGRIHPRTGVPARAHDVTCEAGRSDTNGRVSIEALGSTLRSAIGIRATIMSTRRVVPITTARPKAFRRPT